MSNTTATDASVWNGKDKEAYESLSHPGYSIASDPETHTGGWLAHRAALMPAANGDDDAAPVGDWIQDEIAGMITKFDYANMAIGRPPKVLVLYGSLRESSFSRKLAYENARLG